MADFFEQLDTANSGTDNNKPFFALDHEDDKVLLDWFTKTMAFLKQENQTRLQKVKNNYARYKGIQYREQVYQPRDLPEKRIRYMPQMVVPLISDAIDEKVARLLEYKPGIQVIPHNDETQDKVDTKIAKRFLQHVDQIENLDSKFYKAVKSAKIGGESFLLVLWSKDKGADVIKAGEQVQLADGSVAKGPLKEGDVDTLRATALEVLYERAKSWENVEYLFFFDHEYTEKLKREYPEVAEKIQPSKGLTYYDFENMEQKTLEGQTARVTFWHKKTKFLQDGFECFFTNDVILKKGKLPYEHGELPLERFVDVENEEEVSGEAHIEKTRALASQYNNMTNMIIKQQMLASHPKWFVEGGSVDDQSLGNDISIVKVKAGAKPPVLSQCSPVSPQMFEFRQTLKQEFYEMSKSNSVVRGELPPGVTAFVALQYVSESENRRISSDVTKTNESIRRTYDKILKTCGQFYKKTDKRTMLMLGKDNRWTRMSYNPASLAGPYSLMLQNSSALPDSKALRTQFILDMGQRYPNQFPQEQITEMLDLGQSEKVMDEASKAARAAEDENELILDGKAAPEPQIHEKLIVHWRIHVSAIQDIGFKTKTPKETQNAMKEHIMATEMLMFDMAKKSSAFAQQLNIECPQFPLYMEAPPPPPPMALPLPEQQAVAQNAEAAPVKPPSPLPGDPAYSATPPPKGPPVDMSGMQSI